MDSRVFLSLFIFLLSFPNLVHSSFPWLLRQKIMDESHLRLTKTRSASHHGFDPTRLTQLSWQPRAFLYKGFLTDEECDHLIDLAKDKLEISMVADNESGKSIKSEVRTSSGMFLGKQQVWTFGKGMDDSELQPYRSVPKCDLEDFYHDLEKDDVVSRIEDKIAAWTFLPPENGEAIQILHYELGQKYEPHFDYFQDKANQELGGHRIATVLMYLSNVEKGGETIFPNAEAKETQVKDETWSDCARNGYAVKTRKGDALLFFSLHPDATTDPGSLHGSCPVIEGEKWSATKWIHVRSFDTPTENVSNGECVDENDLCAQWAVTGECQKNPVYMVGSKGSHGYCRKSCNVC